MITREMSLINRPESITSLATQDDLLAMARLSMLETIKAAFPEGISLTVEELKVVGAKFNDIADTMAYARFFAQWAIGRSLDDATNKAIEQGHSPESGGRISSDTWNQGVIVGLAEKIGISIRSARRYRAIYRYFDGDIEKFADYLTEEKDSVTKRTRLKSLNEIIALIQEKSSTKVHPKEEVVDDIVRDAERAIGHIQALNEAVSSGVFSHDELDGMQIKLSSEVEELLHNIPVIIGEPVYTEDDVCLLMSLEYSRGQLNAVSGNYEPLPVDKSYRPDDLNPWRQHARQLRKAWGIDK